MPFGGKPLNLVPHQVGSIDFFPICKHLLEMGSVLLLQGVVHYDLHSLNVLCDSPSSVKLIDFGIAWIPENLSLANVSDLIRQFKPSAEQVAPEVSLLHGMDTMPTKSTEYLLARIEDEKLALQAVYKVLGIPVETQVASLRRFLHQSWSFQEKNWYSFYSLYWSKLDAWSIGIIVLTLYIDFSLDPQFEKTSEYTTKHQSVLNSIKGLCETNPVYRLDALEALELFDPNSPILTMPKSKEWLKQKAEERQRLQEKI
jgi:serine/threonine protein kinase